MDTSGVAISEVSGPKHGFSRCSAVLRHGTILRSSRPLSADEAYDLGQIFISEAHNTAHNYVRALKGIFPGATRQRSDEAEPRYRMAPAIIVDYPEIAISLADQREISSRLCFTAGAGLDHKIWSRFNLPTDMPTSAVLSDVKVHTKDWEALFLECLIPHYQDLAKRRVPDVVFTLYTSVKILICSIVDDKLRVFLEKYDEDWKTFGNFAPVVVQCKKYIDFIVRCGKALHHDAGGSSDLSPNYTLYRAPVSRRGAFNNSPQRTFCSLVGYDLFHKEAHFYGICYEYADNQQKVADSSAHITSGELSFEIGRLY
jgi:hypothetical protein